MQFSLKLIQLQGVSLPLNKLSFEESADQGGSKQCGPSVYSSPDSNWTDFSKLIGLYVQLGPSSGLQAEQRTGLGLPQQRL